MNKNQIWNIKPKEGFEFIYRYYDKKGKSYIGHTKQSLCLRAGGEKGVNYTRYSSKFQEAISKYGFDSFEVEILEEVSSDTVEEREKYYISKYDSRVNGYNSTYGGRAYYQEMKQLFKNIDLRKYGEEEIRNLTHNTLIFLNEGSRLGNEDLHLNNDIDEILKNMKQKEISRCYSYYAFEGDFLEINTHPILIILNFIGVMISKEYTDVDSIYDAMIHSEILGGDLLTGGYAVVKVILMSGDSISFALADYS